MTRDKFLNSISDTFDAGLELIEKKNSDYAGGDDPFKNFRFSEMAGISVEKAIMVRILDKTARIGNLLDRDNAVMDEKVEDTILDVINYYAILKVYLEGGSKTKSPFEVTPIDAGVIETNQIEGVDLGKALEEGYKNFKHFVRIETGRAINKLELKGSPTSFAWHPDGDVKKPKYVVNWKPQKSEDPRMIVWKGTFTETETDAEVVKTLIVDSITLGVTVNNA